MSEKSKQKDRDGGGRFKPSPTPAPWPAEVARDRSGLIGPERSKKGSRISDVKRSEMFRAWCEKQVVEYVAKACQVSPPSVRRVRRADRWDERLPDVRRMAQQKADYTAADAIAQNIKLVRAFKAKLGQRIVALDSSELAASDLAGQLREVVKLELLLFGEATERHAIEVHTYRDLLFTALKRNGIDGPRLLKAGG